VAPQIQRMKSEDLIATVFPDQIACLENIVGEREVPNHPLVRQTLDDCLHEAMDSDAWLALLRRMEQGEVRLICRDLPAPSPLAAAILNARPYAFLDDAPLEERRTQAVLSRRWSDPESADDLGALDAQAIEDVSDQAWPAPTRADEMHEALMQLAVIEQAEVDVQPGWQGWLSQLADQGRAAFLQADDRRLWFARERLTCVQAVYPSTAPVLPALAGFDQSWEADAARVEVIRARLSGCGPMLLGDICRPLALAPIEVEQALAVLEGEGYVLRGQFRPGVRDTQWCERHLLARIHRYTVKRLRREIEPVALQDFMRFLFDWQHLSSATRLQGPAALSAVLQQFEGFSAPAGAWESELLPSRVKGYALTWLDDACRSGKTVWTRLGGRTGAGNTLRSTPIVLLPRAQVGLWRSLDAPPAARGLAPEKPAAPEISLRAQKVLEVLADQGALFFDELGSEAHLLRSELENALQELVAAGQVNADSFAGLRALITPASKRQAHSSRRGRGAFIGGMEDAGRWALLRKPSASQARDEVLEHIAMTLLRRYGVVFWRLLEREAGWLPSWRELLRTLHRLEARGEIRGGRFVSGLAGEQFALPEAIPLLREVRKRPMDEALVTVSAVDPLNLVGTLLPGSKVPAISGNRLVYRDGIPAAAMIAGKPQYWIEEGPALREALIRR
jgi:ATP-dependent Lhr-like helicase